MALLLVRRHIVSVRTPPCNLLSCAAAALGLVACFFLRQEKAASCRAPDCSARLHVTLIL
jgi:hypothetical protein